MGVIYKNGLPYSGDGGGGTSDFNELTNRPKYLGDAMTNKTDVMGFELIEDHDGCYWYDDAYTWMGAWKKTQSGGATGHGIVVSRGQREIGLIKGDAGSSSSQRWRIPMADKVEDMLAEKADKTNTYTKKETDGKIAEAMTDVDNEHFHVVTALPPVTDAKENHEYVLVTYEQDGTTIATEEHYLFYDGAYHKRTTTVSLEGYATEDFVNTKTAKMGEFDVTPIPQGPTGAHEIIAILSNKDTENARVSYVRQSDGTLPNTVNLGVQSGLGEDSFELATTGYVNGKALTPTGWGVAKTGTVEVAFNNSQWGTQVNVDLSDLGLTSSDDYVATVEIVGATEAGWGGIFRAYTTVPLASGFDIGAYANEAKTATVTVRYIVVAKGYGAVAYSGEIPTGGTKDQVLTKRSDADGDYGWRTQGAFTKDGDWWYKINPDNTFEAYYYKSGVSLTIQDNSGNFYRSALQTLNLPTGITSAYDATPLHASVNTSHNNYPCLGTLASIATNQLKYYALSGSSRGASPNYIVTAHVFGTLKAKA